MTVTQSQSKVPASVCNIAHGSYLTTATATAVSITTGFKPRYVKVENFNPSGIIQVEWMEGMTGACGIKTILAGTRSRLTSNGITVADNGFTIGLDTDLNVIDEQMHWQAIG